MMHLTPRESQILSFVALSIDILGHAPTQREIGRRLNVKSRSFIGRTLRNLEAKGLIRLEMYKVRGIHVLKQELRDAA
jgi:SOS-response transcriptional repressor LexA